MGDHGSIGVHELTEKALQTIANGEVGPAEVELFQSAQRSRLLVAMKALGYLFTTRNDSSSRLQTHINTLWTQLGELQQVTPEAVEAVLADPVVASACFRLLRSANSADAEKRLWVGQLLRAREFFTSIVAAVSIRANSPAGTVVLAVDGHVWLPSLGVANASWRHPRCTVRIHPSAEGWILSGGGAQVILPDDLAHAGPGWLPVRRLATSERPSGLRVTVDGVSPHRDFRGPKAPAPLVLKDVHRWSELLREAWRVVVDCAPQEAVAIAGTVRSLVPLPGPARRQTSSASSSDAFGLILLSPPLSPVDLAATLVHEGRHQQLNSLMALTAVSDEPSGTDTEEERYFAPWRGDPRPLMGLLHGAHAFGGVAGFWLGVATHGPPAVRELAWFEFSLSARQLRQAVAALRTAPGLAPAGHRIVDGLAALLRRWRHITVPESPDRLAEWRVVDRWATWRVRHMDLSQDAVGDLVDAWQRRRSPGPLPSALLRPRLSEVHPDVRTSLVRLRLSEPRSFAQVAGILRSGATWPDLPAATPGDAAAVAGPLSEAAAEYRQVLENDPSDTTAWTGLALSLARHRTPVAGSWVRILVERPEVVRALHEALAGSGQVLGPEPLARWLAGAVRR